MCFVLYVKRSIFYHKTNFKFTALHYTALNLTVLYCTELQFFSRPLIGPQVIWPDPRPLIGQKKKISTPPKKLKKLHFFLAFFFEASHWPTGHMTRSKASHWSKKKKFSTRPNFFNLKKKNLPPLWSASVERFSVSRMRDFYIELTSKELVKF